ncbi:hypothetical protein ACFS5M_14080 [Lacinutrix iliipiscaria]|uniref:Uncharacterized protein n=1 Tax=Lacinutrix iliipiscaria TaxID=1230532 RepID=A0ABW5WPW9_9FLAO
MNEIEFYNQNAIVNVDDVAFTFETAENPREFDKYKTVQDTLDWTNQEYQIDNYRVFPFGTNNDLDKVIKDVIQNNSISPGILTKKGQLLWGKGPQLYKEELVDNNLVRTWVQDKRVQTWLESWGYIDYLEKIKEDYSYIQACYTKFYLAKGARVGKPSIAKLEHVSPGEGRLATDIGARSYKPKYCIVTDWNFKRVASVTDYDVYALFDFQKPFEHRNAILYSNKYSFCSDYYTVPDLYGSLEWIRRSTAIPIILKALSKNSINLKYHVISPAKFWDKAKEELEKKATTSKPYTDKQLLDYKKNYLREISKVLSGAENTGKFWHSIKYVTIEGHKIFEEGWEIKEIKQNIKDFVTAQITISNQANRMVAAGVGMHPALGGAGESGRADSGSEQLYALKNYLLTGIDIPEAIVMKAVNYALKINFPEKELKLGFYHLPPQKEEDVTSSKRIKNQE